MAFSDLSERVDVSAVGAGLALQTSLTGWRIGGVHATRVSLGCVPVGQVFRVDRKTLQSLNFNVVLGF